MINFNDLSIKPMLLKEVKEPFDSDDFIFEIKYDGIRALMFVNKNEMHIMSRNSVDLTRFYPELLNIKKNITNNVIFDGEIVLLDEDAKANFSALLERNRIKNNSKILRLSKERPVIFVVFDIVYENKDLTTLPLMIRKRVLNKYDDSEFFVKAKYFEGCGKKLFKEIVKKNMEGIVAKEKNGLYHLGKRTSDFIKIKNIKKDEFFVGGYLVNDKNLSLYIGKYRDNRFYFIGKCSLSMTRDEAATIMKKKCVKNPFCNFEGDINFIKPLACFIEYTEITKNGNLRHPVFKDLK